MSDAWSLRASSYGGCLKGQIAGKLGFKPLAPSETMQGYFDRGNLHEEECAAALRADGWEISDEQLTVEIDGCTGHLDGIIRDYGGNDWDYGAIANAEYVWEAKAPGAWAQFEKAVRGLIVTPLAEKYLWQISLYMHAMGMEAMVSCLDGMQLKSFVIEVPPYSLEEVKARIEAIRSATELPGECSSAEYPCPWVYLHEKVDAPDSDWELDALGAEHEAAKAEVARLRQAIADRTAGESYHSERLKVTYYAVAGRRKADYAAMEADGVLDKYVSLGESSVGMRITTTEIGDTEDE